MSHGPACPKNLLEEAMDTLADITEEEFRVLELIEERQEQFKQGDGGAQGSR